MSRPLGRCTHLEVEAEKAHPDAGGRPLLRLCGRGMPRPYEEQQSPRGL